MLCDEIRHVADSLSDIGAADGAAVGRVTGVAQGLTRTAAGSNRAELTSAAAFSTQVAGLLHEADGNLTATARLLTWFAARV